MTKFADLETWTDKFSDGQAEQRLPAWSQDGKLDVPVSARCSEGIHIHEGNHNFKRGD